jgi:hypothetical protein
LTSIPGPPVPETTGRRVAAAEDADEAGITLVVSVITRLGDEMSVVAEFTSMKSVDPTNVRS